MLARRAHSVRVAHTADLDATTLARAHALLERVFGDELDATDWEHALGGVHALAFEGGEVVGHGSVVQRRLLHGGRALRCGYVEGVAVAGTCRKRGHAGAMLTALERIVRGGYDVGALGTTDVARRFYEKRGWVPWRGPLQGLTPDGVIATPDERGSVLVLPGDAPLELDGTLTADWRDGDLW